MFGNIRFKKESVMTYLGDQLHESGLRDSVQMTINSRVNKVRAAIFEVRAICKDHMIQVVGGAMGAINLWNTCQSVKNCQTIAIVKKPSIPFSNCRYSKMASFCAS